MPVLTDLAYVSGTFVFHISLGTAYTYSYVYNGIHTLFMWYFVYFNISTSSYRQKSSKPSFVRDKTTRLEDP